MICDEVDDLGAAFALDAVDGAERRAISAHLETCDAPHDELRGLLGAGTVLLGALEPVAPSAGLRDRILATVAATAQDPAVMQGTSLDTRRMPTPDMRGPPLSKGPGRRSWAETVSARWAPGLAVGALAASLVLAVVSFSLSTRLDEREQTLQAAAAALSAGDRAIRVEGDAGRGYVVETAGSGATLVLADLQELPPDRLYEVWLIAADGAPVPAGTYETRGAPLAVIAVEDDLEGYATLALTVERQRVEAPTSDPVMVAALES
jgi:hypothetical protein